MTLKETVVDSAKVMKSVQLVKSIFFPENMNFVENRDVLTYSIYSQLPNNISLAEIICIIIIAYNLR
jgi:hypothetical protein